MLLLVGVVDGGCSVGAITVVQVGEQRMNEWERYCWELLCGRWVVGGSVAITGGRLIRHFCRVASPLLIQAHLQQIGKLYEITDI